MTKQEIIDAFHRIFYDEEHKSPILNSVRWLGVPLIKNPLDLWVYAEIMFEIKPHLIIETGTLHGGSALWFAQMQELVMRDQEGPYGVLTIDIHTPIKKPFHTNLIYLQGSSISNEILAKVKSEVEWKKNYPVLVILDSDHRANHVYQELEAYSKFVTPGSYMIVEDTNINGHPVLAGWGKGPMEAIMSWLPKHPEFEIDKSREKFGLTMNPNGYLRRKM